MRITVNGETREITEGQSVASLLSELGIQEERVAVELNLTILNRENFKQALLRDGDRVEVIGFIGGGRGPGHE
jgi:thiamine biosynthesis protein ThiS